jgi:hypothetical protein
MTKTQNPINDPWPNSKDQTVDIAVKPGGRLRLRGREPRIAKTRAGADITRMSKRFRPLGFGHRSLSH